MHVKRMKNKKWWDRFGLDINVFLNINIGLVNNKNLRSALPQRFSRWETSLRWVEELARTQKKDQMIPRGSSPCCCPGLWCWTDWQSTQSLVRYTHPAPCYVCYYGQKKQLFSVRRVIVEKQFPVIRARRKEGLELFVRNKWKGKTLQKKLQAIVFSTG